MNKVNVFLKNNYKFLLILLIIVYIFYQKNPLYNLRYQYEESSDVYNMPLNSGISVKQYAPGYDYNNESVSLNNNRKTIEENFLSLKVRNVESSVNNIKNQAVKLGGFMVNMYLEKPNEASTANITIRVPREKTDEMLKFLKENSIKVVSESLNGRDITDEYQDVEERLRILENNKNRLEELMDKTTDIDQIINIQSRIFSLQDQIDNSKGRLNYLEDLSKTTKLTVYLATDEYALPYVPDTSWNPKGIFKEAVRSLVVSLRKLGSTAIWLGVYSVIWVPLLLIVILIKRKYLK